MSDGWLDPNQSPMFDEGEEEELEEPETGAGRQADAQLVDDLITDDEVIALLDPANAAKLGAIVCHDGRVPDDARFEYPHAAGTSLDWDRRCVGLQIAFGGNGGFGNEIMDQLWRAELLRQVQYTSLASGLDQRPTPKSTADCLTELYGRPDQRAFEAAVTEVYAAARQHADHENQAVCVLAKEVMAALPDLGRMPESLPDDETISLVRSWLMPRVEQWFVAVEALGLGKADKADAAQIATVFGQILEPLGLVAVVTDEVTSITFEPSKGRMAIPPSRKMTPGIMRETVVHEMVHVLRYVNAGDGLLALGRFGLPGYLPFEEGVATALAEVATSKTGRIGSYARPEAYLAIGLASGLLDGRVWTPDQLFQLLWRHYALPKAVKAAKEGAVDVSQVEQAGMGQAWTRLVRTYRGGFELGSVVCTRDLSYRDGNVAVWRWLGQNADHPANLDLLLQAKADLGNPIHLAYVLSC